MKGNQDDASAVEQTPEERALDEQIRAHFQQARQSTAPPHFESLMARAEAAGASGPQRSWSVWRVDLLESLRSRPLWVGGSALTAAAVAVIAALLLVQSGDQPISEDAARIAQHAMMREAAELELLASLESTTRWQAPSDRWLAVESHIDILGIPDIGAPEDLKEKSTWL